MPTSPRTLTGGKCRFLWKNLPFCHRTSRADVGIGPYANGGILAFIRARFFWEAGFPSSGPGCARSTFPVGEGDLPAGDSLFQSVLDL